MKTEELKKNYKDQALYRLTYRLGEGPFSPDKIDDIAMKALNINLTTRCKFKLLNTSRNK